MVTRGRYSQIRDVDGRADLGGILVGEEAGVGECPAVEVVDDDDGYVRVRARHIAALVVDDRLAALGRAIPLEALEAARAHGDGVVVLDLECWTGGMQI